MSTPIRSVITGGAGFIGSHLVDRLLAEGHEVTVVDSLISGSLRNLEAHRNDPRLRVVEADVNERDRIEGPVGEADFIFHLAARGDIVPSIQDPGAYFRSNVDGTFSVLEAARENGSLRKLVYAASSSCYGIPDEVPTPETAPIRTEYPYALTKFLAESLVLHWGKVYRLPVVSIRIFNAYGPRVRTTGAYGAVFGVFLAQKRAGKPLTVVGDGTQRRDFVYVTDVAEAFRRAATSDRTERVYNLGSGDPQSVNRIVEILGGETVRIPRRPGEPDVTHAEIARIRSELGWEPRVPFEKGVRTMLADIDAWRDAPVWTPERIAVATRDWFHYLGGTECPRS